MAELLPPEKNQTHDPDALPNPTGLPEFIEQSPFLRQFIYDTKFRIALVLMFLGAAGMLLCLPKWWQTSPPGFLPVVKLSGLDKLQAWSLRRTARQYQNQGKFQDALSAYRLAIANDAANPELSRELLGLLMSKTPGEPEFQGLAVAQCMWLMKLTSTNDNDVDLSAKVFHHYQLDELVIHYLTTQTKLTTTQARLLLRASFDLQQMELFGAIWERHPELHKEADLALYHGAWQSAWGPLRERVEGGEKLANARKEGTNRVLAHQLQLPVSFALNQWRTYSNSFAYLSKQREEKLLDHVNYWQLLDRAGNKAEAKRLASQFGDTPRNARECLAMAAGMESMGLSADALALLDRYRQIYPSSMEINREAAEIMMRRGLWRELRGLAVEMRKVKYFRDEIPGYMDYLEGVGAQNIGRPDLANEAFNNIGKNSIKHPYLGYQTATALTRMGKLEASRRLLEGLEATHGGKAEYWYQVQMAAYEAKDIESMLNAAEKAYSLAPDHPVVVNNLAASMLMMRRKPAEAIQFTLRKLMATPDNLGAKLNHALALLQNDRVEEAEKLLRTVPSERLIGLYRTIWQIGWFETNIKQGKKTEALKIADEIEKRFLMPPQLKWLEAELEKITPQN